MTNTKGEFNVSNQNKMPVQTEFILRKSNKRIKPLQRHRNEKLKGTVVNIIPSPIPPHQRNERYRVKKVPKTIVDHSKETKKVTSEKTVIEESSITEEGIIEEVRNNDFDIVEGTQVKEDEGSFDETEEVVIPSEYSSAHVRTESFTSNNTNPTPWLGAKYRQS